MTLVPLSLTGKSNPARYSQGGTARLVNCYLEEIGDEGKARAAIYAIDGLQGFAATPEATTGVRAAIVVNGYLWYVAGSSLYRCSTTGEVVLIGSMNISLTAPVYMERNRRATPDIAIVCDGLMYYYRTSFQQVTDADLLAPTSLAFVDGQFVIGTANNTWQVGDIDDVSSWDGLSFERADANPDAVVRVAARQGEAVIFGELSTEFWPNAGLADGTGFSRAAANDLGCLAANSVARVDQTLAWVAHDRTVRLLNGYSGVRISTHAVERDIEDLADKTLIQATSWVRDGHTFYSLTTPSWTWVYDTVTGSWHNRESYGRSNWRVSVVVPFDGKLIAGDADNANLYEMSADFGDEAGSPIVMDMTIPPVTAYPHRLTFDALYIDVEKGVGVGVGASEDVDPELIVSWSDDGGATFALQRALKLGQMGSRTTRLDTRRLGQTKADGRVFRVQCSARVARAVYGMYADVTKDAA